MPRIAVESKHFFTFVRGLVTEATGVTYPENAMVDGSNVDIGTSGICQRRLGVDYEDDYSFVAPTFTSEEITENAVTFHEWRAVNGNGNVNLWVAQVGTRILFGNMMDTSFSAGYLGEIDLVNAEPVQRRTFPSAGLREWDANLLTHYQEREAVVTSSNILVNSEDARLHPLESSYGKGRLFFTSRYMTPFFLEYNEALGSIGFTPITLEERDFQGVDDGLSVDEQPRTLSPTHRYNLRNQGWGDTGSASSAGGAGEGAIIDLGGFTGTYGGQDFETNWNNYIFYFNLTLEQQIILAQTKSW